MIDSRPHRDKWIGPAAILGGSLLILMSITLTHSIALYTVTSLCFLIAIVGLLERHTDRLQAIGRFGLIAAAFGAGLTVVVWGLYALGWAAWLSAFVLTFFLGLHGGMLLFGIEAKIEGLLPRWNTVPLVIGLSFVLPGLLLTWYTIYFWSGLVWMAVLVGGVGWALLGYASWSETPEPDPGDPGPIDPDPGDELEGPLHGQVRDVETSATLANARTSIRAADPQQTEPLGTAATGADGQFVVSDFGERVRESFPDEQPTLRFDVVYEGEPLDVERTSFDWDAFAAGDYLHTVDVHLPDPEPEPDPDCDRNHRSISW